VFVEVKSEEFILTRMELEYSGFGQVIDEKVVHQHGSLNFPDLSERLMTQTHHQQ
jgi:hypothetical protein